MLHAGSGRKKHTDSANEEETPPFPRKKNKKKKASQDQEDMFTGLAMPALVFAALAVVLYILHEDSNGNDCHASRKSSSCVLGGHR